MKVEIDDFPIAGWFTLHDLKPVITCPRLCGGHLMRPCSHMKGAVLHSEHNIIVTLGRQRVAALIGGPGAVGGSDKFVNTMAIGDGGAPQIDLLTPIVPVLADISLVHELTRTTSVNPVRSGLILTYSATFLTASLADVDFISASNKVVNEAAMYAQDNVLFARKTFPSVPFAPGDRVGAIGTWEFEIL